MNRILIALTVTALAVGGAGAASAGGNGAQKAGLAPATGLTPVTCAAADRETGEQTENGFVVLNAPGKPAKEGKNARPDGTHKLVGEVVLRGAAPGVYDVRLASGSGCGEFLGTMSVNQQGHGTYSFEDRSKGAGTWNIVLTQPLVINELPVDVQRYASAPVTVK